MTPEQKARAVALNAKGMKHQDVADDIGMSRAAVSSYLWRRQRTGEGRAGEIAGDVLERAVALRQMGMSYRDISRAVARDQAALTVALRAAGYGSLQYKWTQAHIDRATEMWRAGHSIREISRDIGVGVTAIAHKLHALGVRKLPRGGPAPRDRASRANGCAEGGGWDGRTFLPYPLWKKWNQNRRRNANVEV